MHITCVCFHIHAPAHTHVHAYAYMHKHTPTHSLLRAHFHVLCLSPQRKHWLLSSSSSAPVKVMILQSSAVPHLPQPKSMAAVSQGLYLDVAAKGQWHSGPVPHRWEDVRTVRPFLNVSPCRPH